MAEFQVVVGDPETGDAHQFEVDGSTANRFLGVELGDEVDGGAVGLDGYTLELTGGSDDAGRPMRNDVVGGSLREVLVSGRSIGFKPARDGERKRITVRGREVTEDIAQINATIAERGDTDIADLLAAPDEDETNDEEEGEED